MKIRTTSDSYLAERKVIQENLRCTILNDFHGLAGFHISCVCCGGMDYLNLEKEINMTNKRIQKFVGNYWFNRYGEAGVSFQYFQKFGISA